MAESTLTTNGNPHNGDRAAGRCWRRAKAAGECEVCGYRPVKVNGRYQPHGSKCRQCFGVMRCIQPATGGRPCRYHGGVGNTPGPAHVNYRHGRYSTVLKGAPDLRKHYEQSRHDPDVHDSTEEITILVALMRQTLASLGRGGDSWTMADLEESVRGLAAEFMRAAGLIRQGGDLLPLADRLESLGRSESEMSLALEIVREIGSHRAAVEHWRSLAEQVSRLRERDVKRQVAAGRVVSAETFLHITSTIGDCMAQVLDRQRYPGLLAELNAALTNALAGYIDAPLAVGEAAALAD